MISVQKPKTVQAKGVKNSVSFGIKQDGVAHIFNVLRNQLYTDKVTAVIREYSTNAADAHVEAGCSERPIEVTLPSRFNLQFKVRDFGPALTDNEINDVYAFYGESTKRNTNSQTGMLGIGSKSAFSYGDNFVINSFIDGKKHSYNAFIDDTQVGQIAKLSVEETDEENGLEIVIPVRLGDIDEFRSKSENLFNFFKTKPLVNGSQVEVDYEYTYEGCGWKWKSGIHRYENPIAVMGNIGYPIDTDQLKFGHDSPLSDFACGNLVLELEIGDVEIAASREGLQYTEHTNKNLIKKIKKASEQITKFVQKEFSSCASLWQAKKLSHELLDYNGTLYSLSSLIKKGVSFKGKPIGDARVLLDCDESDKYQCEFHQYARSYRGKRKVSGSSVGRVYAKENSIVILNDEKHRRGVLSRIVPLVEEQDKDVYLLTFKDGKLNKKAIKHLGFIEDDLVKLKSLPENKLDSYVYGSSNGKANKKHSKKLFEFDITKDRYHTTQSDYWNPAEVDLDNEKILYVNLSRFMAYDYSESQLRGNTMHRIIADLVKSEIIESDTKIYGVKLKDSGKLEKNDNAILLWDFASKALKKKIKDDNLGQHMANQQEHNHFENSLLKMVSILDMIEDKNSIAAKVFRTISKNEKAFNEKRKQMEVIHELGRDVRVDVKENSIKANFSASKMQDDMRSTYPLLFDLELCHWRGISDELKERIADYINMVNNSLAV
tara:strand:- start:3430 stop:5580 length:2151 start_codon:yes stop_codon:yes gene_type:complete